MYKSRDETISIRRAGEEELRKDEGTEPEFRISVSRVANGWWLRTEVEALVAKLQAALAEGQAKS